MLSCFTFFQSIALVLLVGKTKTLINYLEVYILSINMSCPRPTLYSSCTPNEEKPSFLHPQEIGPPVSRGTF